MLRCAEGSAGRWRVGLSVIHADEAVHVQIMGHPPKRDDGGAIIDSSPVAKSEEVIIYELCPHELAWLRGVPGRDYDVRYQFALEQVG